MKDSLSRLFVANPVYEEATRAWRKFFRTAGGPGKGMAYAGCLFVGLLYIWILAEIVMNPGGWAEPILFIQLTVVTLAMPVSIYAAVAGERERSTWEALILTRLTPGQIVVGKIVWRLVGLVILMAIFLVPLIVGSYGQSLFPAGNGVLLLNAELMTFAWGFVLCAFGLWVSTNTRHSVTSAALIFITLLAVLALIPALFGMFGGASFGVDDFADNYPMWILMHINAFYAMNSLVNRIDSIPHFSVVPNDPLHGTEWGPLQIAIYFVGALAFIYVTYRSLKIWEEPKHRLG